MMKCRIEARRSDQARRRKRSIVRRNEQARRSIVRRSE